MTPREVVGCVLDGKKPPYVPWSFKFTKEAANKLAAHYGTRDLDAAVGNHMLRIGNDIGFFTDIGGDCVRDAFGVVWDRSVDKDIGIVRGCVIPEPTLAGYAFPDPEDRRFFDTIDAAIDAAPRLFRVFEIGFSLFERAWTLRGMQNLLLDFFDSPGFVHEFLGAIADYDIAQARKAMRYDIDAVYFGDDWGQQRGLIMGRELWREFILPQLTRMYAAVRDEGMYVMIHSCGDVDELLDDLIAAGLHSFNPFQPEVMDVWSLLPRYRSRLTFHGGLSTQKTLPHGTVAQVRDDSRRLLELGAEGGFIFSPAHSVEGDVPLANMLAFIDEARKQRGYAV